MGSVFKPISGKASRPFYLDRICVSIYSGDELIFCLGEYPELLSTDMFNKDLIKWLSEDCSAKDLAEVIEKLIRAKADITNIVSSLLKRAPFISDM